jgi:tetratricopeptide (TPR) repeat protein
MKTIWLIYAACLTCWLGNAAGPSASAQARHEVPTVQRPTAKSQQELNDYKSARTANDGAAAEKAAISFAEKYPDSELRRYLFSKALRAYQGENNSDGMLAMGQRVLSIDPGDALALVLTATVVADSLSAGDPDRERKVAEIKQSTTRALQAVEGKAMASQSPIYRTTLQSMALSASGIMKLKTGDDSGAEKDLKLAAELPKIRPDPYIWYHLALAQDHRRRYPAALNSVEQAMQLASANPKLQQLAETEYARLNRLAGHSKGASESDQKPAPE